MRNEYFLGIVLLMLILVLLVSSILPAKRLVCELEGQTKQLEGEIAFLIQQKHILKKHLFVLDRDIFYTEFLLREKFHYAGEFEDFDSMAVECRK